MKKFKKSVIRITCVLIGFAIGMYLTREKGGN